MAGRPREPIDLIKAKGRKHLTEKEYEERKSSELQVPFTDVEPPECLTTKKQIAEFHDISEKLLALNIFTELDVDALARYILSKVFDPLEIFYFFLLEVLLSDILTFQVLYLEMLNLLLSYIFV